jgi:hypothetical protein
MDDPFLESGSGGYDGDVVQVNTIYGGVGERRGIPLSEWLIF